MGNAHWHFKRGLVGIATHMQRVKVIFFLSNFLFSQIEKKQKPNWENPVFEENNQTKYYDKGKQRAL